MTGAESCRWTTSAIRFQWDRTDLNRHQVRLRVRYAAANTSIPLSSQFSLLLADQSARRESNPRSGPYKRPAITVELRAASGAGGI